MVVSAGHRELARFQPAADFSRDIDVPADALAAASGHLTIATNLTFVPADRETSPDRRTLGLKLWQVEVRKQ